MAEKTIEHFWHRDAGVAQTIEGDTQVGGQDMLLIADISSQDLLKNILAELEKTNLRDETITTMLQDSETGRRVGVNTVNRLTVCSISTPIVHHELHEGELFTCHYENTVTTIGEMSVMAFNTPSDKTIHLAIKAEATGVANLYLYENTSIDVGEGTTLTVNNRNRQSNNQSGLSTIEAVPAEGSVTRFDETQAVNANITTTTELWQSYLGSVLKQAYETQTTRTANEWILAKNQQYAVVVVTATDNDNVINIVLNWQEEVEGGHGHKH